jgi:hypothetical protein
MSGPANGDSARLRVTKEEAHHLADLLRYVVSLNTTAGLVSPTERRLTTSTCRSVELAALVLEGRTFEEAVKESEKTWTGSLEDDHRRALEMLEKNREILRKAMTGRMTPEQIGQFLEITQEQFLELTRSGLGRPG